MENQELPSDKNIHGPADEYNVFNDNEMNHYYDNLKIKITPLIQRYDLKQHEYTESYVVNLIWEYKELFPRKDTYLLDLAEFLNLLLKSTNTDESIEVRYGAKKIKIQSELSKQRISFVINTLLVEGIRDEMKFNLRETVNKKYRFVDDLTEHIKHFKLIDSIQFDYYSRILNLATELITNQELDTILKTIHESTDSSDIEKYSKQKRTELIRIVQEIIKKLRETGVFNKELKTIATKEACFLYDILVCSDIIKLDPYFNGQEKYQFIKRFLKE